MSEMNGHSENKLILVEGLSGSGKSTIAHFIARQLQHNGIKVNWFHEGERLHPISMDVESCVESYMTEMLEKWTTLVKQMGPSGEVTVIEARFFCNVIESLLIHNVERSRIVQYGDGLQEIIEPLNPALVYLAPKDIARAFEQNFRNRGEGFKDSAIQYVTSTPYGKKKGLEGYDGVVALGRDFVAITDELFEEYRIKKLRIDISGGDWDSYNRRVMEFLSIPLVLEPVVCKGEAMKFVGRYRDRKTDQEFLVEYENEALVINLWEKVKSKLIRRVESVFCAEGWPYEILFEEDDSGRIDTMKIGGRDVYDLSLVGTVAPKAS